MPSADHSRQALLRQADWLASVSSPRVRTNSFPSCTFGLYIAVSVWLLGFNLFGSLTRQHMPETVSVRKVNGLPRASFSRNLAVQALPLAMCLAPPPAFRDFHPIEFAHAERTKTLVTDGYSGYKTIIKTGTWIRQKQNRSAISPVWCISVENFLKLFCPRICTNSFWTSPKNT